MGPTEMAVFPYQDPGVGGALTHAPNLKPAADGSVIYLRTQRLDETLGRVTRAGGRIVLDKTPVTLADLGQALEEKGAASRPVYLRADQRVPYGVVAEVIGRARAAGVTQLGLVTEPDERPRR